MNQAALDLIGAYLDGEPYYSGSGAQMDFAEAARFRAWLFEEAGRMELRHAAPLYKLVDAIDEAQAGHLDLIFALRMGTVSEAKATIRHEWWHRMQDALGQGSASRHLEDLLALLTHPLAGKAQDGLKRLGYDVSNPYTVAVEIGAHLVAGPVDWQAIGLGEPEAVEFFEHYADLLYKEHGDKIAWALHRIHPILRRALRNAEQVSAAGQRGRRPAGAAGLYQGPQGEPGVPRGPPEGVRARAGESGEQGRLFEPEQQPDYQAQLLGDQLTAEFNSPLTRGNLRQPLKPAPPPAQGDLFGGPAPGPEGAPPQGTLFSRRETGPHGPIFREFYHDAKGAIAKLREVRTGEAVGALYHPEVGDIDLIWGDAKRGGGYGLAKIVARHPEVLDDLQGILDGLTEVRRSAQTVFLEDPQHTALVRLNWLGQQKTWLLTAYETRREPSTGRMVDVSGAHAADRQAPQPGGSISNISPPTGKVKGTKGSVERFLSDEEGALRLTGPGSLADNAAVDFLSPLMARIARQGGPVGARLARLLERVTDLGEVAAGKRVARLSDLEIEKLSREDRFNLLDVLEGRRGPRTAQIRDIATEIRSIQNEIAAEATRAGALVKQTVTVKPGDPRPITLTKQQHLALDQGKQVRTVVWRPFRQRIEYFPHVIRSTGELKHGQLRKDIVENLQRMRIARDAKQAVKFLDDYIRFVEKGGRVDSLINYLVRTNQASDDAEAFALLNRFREHAVKRQGSLEYSREINLPFFDPDPARVLPQAIASQSIRLAQIAGLGQHNQVVNRAVKDIRDLGGDWKLVEKAVDLILGHVQEADGAAARLSRFIRALQGFKLTLSSIPNATQGAMNTLLAGDLRAALAGARGLATKQGRRFGIESGATLESVINESLRHAGASGHALSVYLKATGFTATERANRVFAANAGANYASRLAARLHANPQDQHTARRLAELGVDPRAAAARGGRLTADEVLMAAKKFSDITQFRSRPQDLPMFAESPEGKVFFQFKSYIYGQTRLLYREIVDEALAGNYGRAARSLLVLGLVFPLAGAGIEWLRDLLTGRKRKDEGRSPILDYLHAIAQVGALGILGDLVQASEFNRVAEWLLGPGLGDLAEAAHKLIQVGFSADREKALENLGKFAYRRIPGLGQLSYYWLFGKRPPAALPRDEASDLLRRMDRAEREAVGY